MTQRFEDLLEEQREAIADYDVALDKFLDCTAKQRLALIRAQHAATNERHILVAMLICALAIVCVVGIGVLT